MKRYSFLFSVVLSILLISSQSLWAECYVDNVAGISLELPYVNDDGNTNGTYETITLFSPGKTLTFTYQLKENAGNWHKLSVEVSKDKGSSWSSVWSSGKLETADANSHTISLSANVTHIRFKRTGRTGGWFNAYRAGKTISVTNIYVSKASSLSVSPASITFANTPVGAQSDAQTATITYTNLDNKNISVSSSSTEFVATPKSTTLIDDCGTTTVSVYFKPTTVGSKSETITISNGTLSASFSVNGTAAATTDPTHDWKGGNSYMVDDAIDLSSAWESNSEGSRTYSIVNFAADNSSETGATAPAISGTTLTLGQAGTLTIRMMQEANSGYHAKTSELTIIITKYNLSASISQTSATWDATISNPFYVTYSLADYVVQSLDPTIGTYADGAIQTYAETGTARFLISRPEDYKYNQLAETLSIKVAKRVENCTYEQLSIVEVKRSSYDYVLPYACNQISIQFSIQSAGVGGNITLKGYASDGTWIQDICSLNRNKLSSSAYLYDIDTRIRKIQFYADGTGYTYAQNFIATRANYLTPSTDAFSMSSSKGQNGTATFDVAYGSCGSNVKVVSNNPKITVSPTSFYAVGNGTQTITITGDASEEGTETATITLYDQSKKTTVTFTNTTIGKLATHIEYTGQASYAQSAGEQQNPFRVIDANGAEVVGAKVTMTSSDIAVLWVSEDGVSSFTPSCGGNVTLTATYAGDDAHQPSTLSKTIFVEKCTHHIEWQQSLMGFTATAEGEIDETVLLTAKAMNDNGTATNIPITYTIADPSIATLIDNGNGTYSVQVTAVGETTITATTAEDDTYATESVTHSIRVRREGEACHSFAIEHANQLSMFMGDTTDELVISGLPDQLTFDAKRGGGAIGNGITIQYYDGSSWQDLQTIDLTGSWASYGPYTVPEAAKRLRFEGSGTLSRYVRNIYVTQKTYLRADVASIRQQATVHRAFESRFKVDFSDIPVIQYSISNTGGLGLSLTCDRDVTNNCGEYGTYTFTLFGICNTPCTLSETIYLSTSAGHSIKIPVEIEVTLSGTYTFNIESGTWDESSKWDKGLLPDDAAEAVVSVPVTLNTHAEVYSLRIEGNGVLTIGESGGLTVYEGGVTSSNASQIHLISNHSGAGFLRISPHSSVSAPAVTTHYTTRSTLSTGANKDATWQYVGAPGDHCTITTDGSQWLYIWDEQNGWVRKSGTLTLTPFAGYALTQYGQPTYEWTSTMIVGNPDIVLTKTASGMNGENVFVNSYAAPIDVKRFTAEDFEGDMDKTLYLFNAGSWNQWNAGETDGSNLGKNGDDTPGHYCAIPALAASYMDPAYDITTIPPMQGVYVKTRADGAVIHLNYEKHVWNAADSHLNRPMRKAEQNEESSEPLFMRIRLQANSSNSGADRLYVIQDTLFSSEYDNGYDAPKEIADGLMNLYVSEPFGQAEVSCTDRLDGTQIGFLAGEDGDYSLRFTSIETTEPIYLKDMETDICVEIEDHGEYAFTAQPFSNNPARFMLLLTPAYSPDGPTTATDDAPQQAYPSSLKIFRNGHLYISIGDQLYDMVGRRQ